jgi:AAA domain
LYGRALPLAPRIVFGSAKPLAPARDWTLENYSIIQVEPIRWVFRNLLALGKATGLVGEPGGGKSLFTVDLAARITTGRGFPDGAANEIPASSVLMLTEDGAGDTIKPRFLTAGGEEKRLYQLRLPTGVQFSVDNQEDMRRLDGQLTAHPDIRSIIIDPILQHVVSEKEQDVRRGVGTLLGLLQKHNIAALRGALQQSGGKESVQPPGQTQRRKSLDGFAEVRLRCNARLSHEAPGALSHLR